MSAAAREAFEAGKRAWGSLDLPGAKQRWSEAVSKDPQAWEAYQALGAVEERLGNADAALAAYRSALSAAPDYDAAARGIALLLARTGRKDDANRFLAEQMSARPNSAELMAAAAEVKSLSGDSAEAQRLAQRALKLAPDCRSAMLAIARDHYRARKLDLALYTLQGLLDGFGPENPPRAKDSSEAWLLRGLIYREQRNRAGAMDQFRKALELDATSVDARVALGAYLLESGNAAEAATLYEGAARLSANDPLVRLGLGDCYRLLGRVTDARQQLDWVAQKRPELAEVQYDLGLLYLFAPQVPGMTPSQAIEAALAAFHRYKELKPRGGASDVDELITRATTRKAMIEAEKNGSNADAEDAAPAQPAAGGGK